MPGLPENQEVTFDEELATVQEPRKRLRVGCGAGASRAVPDRFPAPTLLRAEWPSPGGACEKEPLGTPLPPPHLPSKTGPVLWKGYRPTSGWERQLPPGGNALCTSQENPSSKFQLHNGPPKNNGEDSTLKYTRESEWMKTPFQDMAPNIPKVISKYNENSF